MRVDCGTTGLLEVRCREAQRFGKYFGGTPRQTLLLSYQDPHSPFHLQVSLLFEAGILECLLSSAMSTAGVAQGPVKDSRRAFLKDRLNWLDFCPSAFFLPK